MTSAKILLTAFIGLSLFFSATNTHGQEQEESAEPPVVLVEGLPYIMIYIEDEVGEYDAWKAHEREIMLKTAFEQALKRSKLAYAYSISFQPKVRPKWVPELKLRIVDWRYSETEAIVCSIDAEFFDAFNKRIDLKGAYGTEMTLGMSGDKHDFEDHMISAAAKAMHPILKRLWKKGLYKLP